MSAKNELKRRLRRGAESVGCEVDARGYVANRDANLRTPLSVEGLAAFARMPSSELEPARTRPPRFFALHSSAALVANVFGHWETVDRAPLLRALGVEGAAAALRFEQPLTTGLAGDAPHVDVAIELDTGRVVAIESKLTEWLTRRPKRGARFKDKYFPPKARLWMRNALPQCQALAEDIQSGRVSFKYLHAAQLLKHALGLAAQHGRAGLLYYLYYDYAGPASTAHCAEIEDFRARVDRDLGFAALSYQDLFRRLRSERDVDAEYLDYLRRRYFADQ